VRPKRWWVDHLPFIEAELRSDLARRSPRNRQDHDDLVNETLLQLSRWLERHPFQESLTAPRNHDDDAGELVALARVILRRRVADRHRMDAREWSRRVSAAAAERANVAPRARGPERELLLRQMLEITIGVLANLSSSDRDLIAIAGAAGRAASAMSPRDRQRLARARRRIRDAILRELGESVSRLLRGDE
jgi:DNA-directed RNA polymerase specialized sigma24 family protein